MTLASGFSLSTGTSKVSQSKVSSERMPQCHKALCFGESAPETLPTKETLGMKGSLFLPFAPPTLCPSMETDRKLSFGSVGVIGLPQWSGSHSLSVCLPHSQPLASLVGSPSRTHHEPTHLPPISTATKGVQAIPSFAWIPHLSPSFYYCSLIIQVPHSSQNDL